MCSQTKRWLPTTHIKERSSATETKEVTLINDTLVAVSCTACSVLPGAAGPLGRGQHRARLISSLATQGTCTLSPEGALTDSLAMT